jgi:hypothetical protein
VVPRGVVVLYVVLDVALRDLVLVLRVLAVRDVAQLDVVVHRLLVMGVDLAGVIAPQKVQGCLKTASIMHWSNF